MLKAGRISWVLLVLFGLLLIPTLIISELGIIAAQFTPATAQAANTHIDSPVSQCTTNLERPSFSKSVVVNTQEVVCSDITSFGGTVDIKGVVYGDVVAFGSSVVVDGVIRGDVHLYGSSATLHNGSQLHGNILLYGGSYHRDRGAVFDGQSINKVAHFNWLFGGVNTFSFPLWSILTWVALGLILTLLLPEHVMLVSTTATNRKGRSFVVGLLTILIAPAILVVLIALILPIPLAIIVALGLITAWALGMVALGWLIGEQILQAMAPQRNTRTMQIVVGLTALTLLGALPYIGWLINIVAGLLGLGAVLLSRFGTRLYGRPRGPLNL
jgi:hypothetical protein